jgi:hypothetical protein
MVRRARPVGISRPGVVECSFIGNFRVWGTITFVMFLPATLLLLM